MFLIGFVLITVTKNVRYFNFFFPVIFFRQVLAEEAHPVEDLDAGACRELLSGAQGKLSSASTDVERAEAELPLKWPRLSSRLSNKVRAKHQPAGESVSSTRPYI